MLHHQIKCCYSEEEANKFLLKLEALRPSETPTRPFVSSIQFSGLPEGEGTDNKVVYKSNTIIVITYTIPHGYDLKNLE